MQNFKILLGYFWLNLKFTPNYIIVGGEYRLLERLETFFLVPQEALKYCIILALLLLINSEGYVKFIPKCTIVGGEGLLQQIFKKFKTFSFGY